jgi:hypothetical protein
MREKAQSFEFVGGLPEKPSTIESTVTLPCGPRRCVCRSSKGFCSIPSGFHSSGSGRGEDCFPPGFERPAYSGAGMQFRGAASLADVPYWRKPKNRLTAHILPRANHFLKAIFAHWNILIVLFTITYGCSMGSEWGMSWRRVSFGFRCDFHKFFRDVATLESPTISYTVCGPGYKITLLFKNSWRILIVSYEEAMDHLSRDDRFKATIYAMNTLLIHKGIYTQKEFQQLFVEWASKQSKVSTQEISHEARISV